jgi:hypothetical protein
MPSRARVHAVLSLCVLGLAAPVRATTVAYVLQAAGASSSRAASVAIVDLDEMRHVAKKLLGCANLNGDGRAGVFTYDPVA